MTVATPTGALIDDADAALIARLRRYNLIAGVAAAGAVIGTVLVTAWLSQSSLAKYMATTVEAANAETVAIAAIVNRQFHELEAMPKVLANSGELRSVGRKYTNLESDFGNLPFEERAPRRWPKARDNYSGSRARPTSRCSFSARRCTTTTAPPG